MSLDKSIPSVIKSNSFQAWATLAVLLLTIVVVYDSYTGKRLLKFLFPKGAIAAAPVKPKEEA